jgi:hypothetical protein
MDSSDASNAYITGLDEATTYTFYGWTTNSAGDSAVSTGKSATTEQTLAEPIYIYDGSSTYIDTGVYKVLTLEDSGHWTPSSSTTLNYVLGGGGGVAGEYKWRPLFSRRKWWKWRCCDNRFFYQ